MNDYRLDVYICNEYGYSREYAKELILSGKCILNGKIIIKPSYKVRNGDKIELTRGAPEFVSRGGHKLNKALSEFRIDINSLICADIGASTGGFTDVMLKRGAKKVYAIDCGTDQLCEKLKHDDRVVQMDHTNIRDLFSLPEKPDFVAADVSFISLTKIIVNIKSLINDEGAAVLLIKPQFEAGNSNVGKNGIVKNVKAHKLSINNVICSAISNGFCSIGLTYSPIKGQNGNIEYLLYLCCKENESSVDNSLIESVICEAFDQLK